MKYILIFWLAANPPTSVPSVGAFACVQDLRVLESQFKGVRGLCLPMDGNEGNFHRLLMDVNPTIPN